MLYSYKVFGCIVQKQWTMSITSRTGGRGDGGSCRLWDGVPIAHHRRRPEVTMVSREKNWIKVVNLTFSQKPFKVLMVIRCSCRYFSGPKAYADFNCRQCRQYFWAPLPAMGEVSFTDSQWTSIFVGERRALSFRDVK